MLRAAARTLAVLLLAAPALAAQEGSSPAHARVAGCYAIEPALEAPWLEGVDANVRLTLEPMKVDPGTTPAFVVRAAAARASAPRYPYQSWSLYGDGEIVSIVWTSETDMIGLTFVPAPGRAGAVSLGSTTLFTHEMMRTTPPVDVRVIAIDCGA